MNFKIISFLIFLSLTFTSCGVKAPPEKYPSTVVDSYIKSYVGGNLTPEEMARTKDLRPDENTPEPTKVPTAIPQP